DGCSEGGFLFFPARTGGNDDRYRIRVFRAGKLHTLADTRNGSWCAVQSTSICRGMVDRRPLPAGRCTRLVILEPERAINNVESNQRKSSTYHHHWLSAAP